ncbi:MAG TPA: hypothetical protein DEA96_10620 [Leptospiraceae bacterium]|nr:hypothetical protein [Leptospiraceae bacterium]
MACWFRSLSRTMFRASLFALLLSSVVLARSLNTSLGSAPAMHPPAAVSSDSWFFSSRSLQLDRSRHAVAQFYRDHYVPYGKVQNHWSGSTNGCRAGKNSPEYDEATLQTLKFYRAMAGVPTDISFAEKYNGMARATALMMEAKNDLSHGPGTNWPCYTSEGKSGAGSSNLCLGCVGPSAIDAYVQDAGVEGVGHRQWALHPQQKVLGTGSSARAHALYVFGDWRPEEEVEKIRSVAWPPEGFVPYRFGLDSGYPWSYTSFAPDGDLSRAKVQMSRDGKNVSVRQEQGRKDLLVWYPAGLERATHQNNYNRPAGDVTIQVRISNVIIQGKATTVEYSVTFIDPDAVLSEEDSENTDPGIDSDADPGSEEGTDTEVQITIDPALNGPMLQAIYQGNTKLALDLLSRGADPNARYQGRWTALMYAAYYGHEDIVKELLRRGADASVQLDGWDARSMAKYRGHESIAALIGKRTQSSPVPGRRAIRPPAP